MIIRANVMRNVILSCSAVTTSKGEEGGSDINASRGFVTRHCFILGKSWWGGEVFKV